ncbi:MAG: dockerin type I repeat-containing protein [Muribaculaceae bacterium]|nr:dockerin type I repeat-containing protein [Muribaculaceae bacterium]
MKKIITLFACVAVFATATAGDVTTTVTQTTNPAKEFLMSKSSEGNDPMNVYSELTIQYYGTIQRKYYFVECMIHPEDMEDVPIGAKVTSIACGGEKKLGLDGKESADSLYLAAYIRNDVDPATDSYTLGGYDIAKASYNDDELYGPMTKIGLSAPEGEEAQVIHSDFDIAKPFLYTGNIFKVGMDMYLPDAVFFRYYTTYAVEEVATTYHIPAVSSDNNICLYYDCEYSDYIDMMHMLGVDMYFNPNTLPAFTLSYYTNDVKGKVTGAGGELVLSGGEEPLTKTVAAGEEFAFENVDYTKTYTLTLNGEVIAENLAFEDITKDIYVEIAASGDTPMVGDVDGDGTVTAADVTALYNWLLNSDASSLVNGDQDCDGVITSSDVTVVYNVLLGSK